MINKFQPTVVLIGGPNGAGKTTVAPGLLGSYLNLNTFVNADVLAKGLSGMRPETEALAAGRLMISHLHQLASERKSFAFETTLASRTFAPWLQTLIRDGYTFHLIYLWIDDVTIAINRVAARVRAGGHDVPVETIRRRYLSGLHHFFHLYKPMATSWQVYDSSRPNTPMLIASGGSYAEDCIIDEKRWSILKGSINGE